MADAAVHYNAGEAAGSAKTPGQWLRETSSHRYILSDFQVGKPDLKAEHQEFLKKLIKDYGLDQERSAGRIMTIEGYTDPVDTESVNLGLRQTRADAVARFLKEKNAGDHIANNAVRGAVKGVFLRVKHDTPPDRAANRGVRITIKPIGYVVVVVGSNKSTAFPFQFITAAEKNHPIGEAEKPLKHPTPDGLQEFIVRNLWFVEKTGYDLLSQMEALKTKQPLEELERKFGVNPDFHWITPEKNLVWWLNELPVPERSVLKLVLYSHGLPGFIALRYDWGSEFPDYGLNIADTKSLKNNTKFAPRGSMEMNSCNTGVAEYAGLGDNLAQILSDKTKVPVEAWTGRTSYADINAGRSKDVAGSRLGTGKWDTLKELWSRTKAGEAVPRKKIFKPKE